MGGGRCRPSAWRPGTPWVETAATAHHGLGGERSAALTRSHARLQVRKPRLVVVCGLRLDCWTVVSLWLGANLFLLSRKQWWSGLGGEESQPGRQNGRGTAQIARLCVGTGSSPEVLVLRCSRALRPHFCRQCWRGRSWAVQPRLATCRHLVTQLAAHAFARLDLGRNARRCLWK